jgi:hypothetical protein
VFHASAASTPSTKIDKAANASTIITITIVIETAAPMRSQNIRCILLARRETMLPVSSAVKRHKPISGHTS